MSLYRSFGLITINLFLLLINFSASVFQTTNVVNDNNKINNINNNVNYRLPNNSRPQSYIVDLKMLTNENDLDFSGSVTIRLQALSDSSSITLHTHNLKIFKVQLLKVINNQIISILDPVYDNVTELLIIPVKDQILQMGLEYDLSISYQGKFHTTQNGVYRSNYQSEDGKLRWFASTKFEPTKARHAFPCYDEPALKATFSIKITHASGYTAISNMPQKSRVENSDGTATTEFKTTPPTPPYMLAFHISDFRRRENQNDSIVAILARPNAIGDADFAINTVSALLDAFSKYLGVPYPMEKMDLVAIPDMNSSALTNWGLTKYRESDLLLTNESTFLDKQKCVQMLAHQMAHQWFGNLVTPEWWSYIWLNEAFAKLFEYIAVDWIYPEWLIKQTIVPNLIQPIFHKDDNRMVRPLTHYVENPADIDKDFDEIAYDKGAAVLSMIMDTLTEDTFKKALKFYLETSAYSNVTEAELFAAFEYAAQLDGTLSANTSISDIFSSWTQQSGFPILYVMRNYANETMDLIQERYFAITPNSFDQQYWWIPINYVSARNIDYIKTTPDYWLSNNEKLLQLQQSDLTLVSNDDWIVFNKKGSGYFRVRYDDKNYQMIYHQLHHMDHTKIDSGSRSQILDDGFEFTKNGWLKYDLFLNITKYLKKERDFAPWVSACNGFDYLKKMMSANNHYDFFKKFLISLVEPVYEYLGTTDYNGEYHFNKIFRNQAIHWTCSMGSEKCLNKTLQIFENFLYNNQTIHQNLQEIIYCNGYQASNYTNKNIFWKKLESTTNSKERLNIINAFGCSSNRTYLLELLENSINNGTMFKNEDERSKLMQSASQNNEIGVNATVEFLNKSLDSVAGKYGQHNMGIVMLKLAEWIVTDEQKSNFDDIIEISCEKSYITESICSRALTIVDENRYWIDENQETVAHWLHNEFRSGAIISKNISWTWLSMLIIVIYNLI